MTESEKDEHESNMFKELYPGRQLFNDFFHMG